MSMEFDRTMPRDPVTTNSVTEREDVMFAAQPVWDRNRKRRLSGGRKTTAATASVPASTGAAERSPSMTTTRTRKVEQRSSVAPIALTAGVAGLVALGAAGWFVTRDAGVPELVPSETTTMEVAAAPVMPAPMPPMAAPAVDASAEVATPPAVNDPVPARAAPVARTRPSPATPAAPSVDESGVNASSSAVLPDGPQPYSTLNPDSSSIAAPPPVESAAPPIPEIPPVQAEPTPLPVNPVNPAAPVPSVEETPPL
ncbi:MAG: hypothetical protein U1C74_07475 [Phenylobacterium sp.]|nr:hypothetical protein [Phenylobacterium sp.]